MSNSIRAVSGGLNPTPVEPSGQIAVGAAFAIVRLNSLFGPQGPLAGYKLNAIVPNPVVGQTPHFYVEVAQGWRPDVREACQRVIDRSMTGAEVGGWVFEVRDSSNLELPQRG